MKIKLQWQILIQRSGLVQGYTVWQQTVPLDQTSRSRFTTVKPIYET